MRDEPRSAGGRSRSSFILPPSSFGCCAHEKRTAVALKGAAGVVLFAAFIGMACAQYPSRPLRLVVPYPAGGNADVVARILGNEMAKGLGQHIVVETRPGAGGTIGADAVAKATPDGHTLLLVTGGHAVAGASYRLLPYRTVDSFSMISTATFFPFVLAVRADGGYPSLPALLQAAKTVPGSV